jgi:hypothetical protein
MRMSVVVSPKAPVLVDALFENPYLNTARVKALLSVTDPTGRAAIAALEEAGIVAKVTGRSCGKQYFVRGVLRTIKYPIAECFAP